MQVASIGTLLSVLVLSNCSTRVADLVALRVSQFQYASTNETVNNVMSGEAEQLARLLTYILGLAFESLN